ncbi:pyridoxamine 5'-phosphate oxidase family protein [Micromonospora halotolerans]|uniref:Pyridoxamine 5'-phosphate oxidase family protein n=1 Tax=Micromonospora halotolerans TaxID=709879 RepID=A0ABZ0A2S2_9ACTN|nr:pyridoxamine 5'-phosphate oxidase family protein [Micromonospora halotolerans]WNM41515.1 pyridoxamine 5'-phosphate oxidase family protein [Micromonospora halotolerans]
MTTREITSPEELAELLGAPTQRARDKERTVLHQRDREWLAASPFCLIATAGADGSCDVSPKGDPAGFTLVLDETTIAIPERPGNRRADGYRNILANPHVGLIFLIPGRTDTLRINGRARLVTDAPYFADMVVKGHRPVLAVEVAIEQIFYHCAKAFLRSELWRPETWQPDALPTRARLVKEVEASTENLADLERHYGPDYVTTIYA